MPYRKNIANTNLKNSDIFQKIFYVFSIIYKISQ